jgi:hypothetical protein
MRRKILLLAAIVISAVSTTNAQKSSSFATSDYTTALGIKLNPAIGGVAVTFKHFMNQQRAFEALGTFWERGTRLTGLYEFNWDIRDLNGLKWYVGPGAHLGFYNDEYHNENHYGASYVSVGIDGVIGLDYKFNNIPLNLSVDWQPAVEFGTGRYNGFAGDFGGFSARYTF